MKIKKKYRFIEIETDDEGKFTDIALLVDRLDYISEIEQTRSKYHELDCTYPLSKTDLEKIQKSFEYYRMPNDEQLRERFDSDVERIRKVYKRPPHFKGVIAASIMYGKVYDLYYSKAYMEKQEITPTNNPDEIPDIKYCIVIHSGTRLKDITKVFDKFKEEVRINFKASKKEKSAYNFGYWFDFSLTKPVDTKNSIKELRTLYHLRKNGMSPLKIALANLKISEKQYRNALQNSRGCEDEDVYSRCSSLVENIERRRDSIKSLIKRYSDLLLASNTIL